MSPNQKPLTAFILSLLSGIFINLGSVFWLSLWANGWSIDWMGGMMHGWEGTMRSWGLGNYGIIMSALGVIFGTIVIVSAIMLYINPLQHEIWGVLILVFSAASVLSCMGGMIIGLLLGIAGGILAIIYKHQSAIEIKISNFTHIFRKT